MGNQIKTALEIALENKTAEKISFTKELQMKNQIELLLNMKL